MGILNAIKFIFELRGTLSGYKTYIGIAATLLALVSGFLANQIIPWMDGGMDTVTFVKNLPEFFALVTGAWTAGAMRHAIEKSS